MWSHARLLRRLLLLVSVLTLSGVHDQPADGWRAARLLPLSLCLVFAVAHVGHLVRVSGDGYKLMYSLTLGATYAQGSLCMLFLLRYRRRIHALLQDVAALDGATAICSRPGDYKNVLRQSVLFSSIQTSALLCWTIGFFVTADLVHPNYFADWQAPVALQGFPWYGMVIAFQIVAATIGVIYIAAVDVLMAGLMDAVAVFHDRLSTYCERCLSCSGDSNSWALRTAHQRVGRVRIVVSSTTRQEMKQSADPIQEESYDKKSEELKQGGPWTTDQKSTAGSGTDPESVLTDPCRPSPERLQDEGPPQLKLGMQQLLETYATVRHLASDAASLCSLPTLSQHAGITMGLLLGSYVSILMYRTDVATWVEMVSFTALNAATTLRMVMTACAGSRLIERGERLHQTLAEVRWPAAVPASVRFSMQLMLEQTRQPLGFDGWGLFTVQKSNMLALFSFVLTYFVILVQMQVA